MLLKATAGLLTLSGCSTETSPGTCTFFLPVLQLPSKCMCHDDDAYINILCYFVHVAELLHLCLAVPPPPLLLLL